METQKFIEDAIKGGWNPKPQYYSPRKPHSGGVVWSGDDNDTEFYSIQVILLLPQAWKAVGIVRNWNTLYGFPVFIDREDGTTEMAGWRREWQRFINFLADGLSIEEALVAMRKTYY
jgi:hypothetical protein